MTTTVLSSTLGRSRTRDFAPASAIVSAFVDEHGLNGAGAIVVGRNEGVLYHEHFGEFDEDRMSLVSSSTKMITAGVLLHLHEERSVS